LQVRQALVAQSVNGSDLDLVEDRCAWLPLIAS